MWWAKLIPVVVKIAIEAIAEDPAWLVVTVPVAAAGIATVFRDGLVMLLALAGALVFVINRLASFEAAARLLRQEGL